MRLTACAVFAALLPGAASAETTANDLCVSMGESGELTMRARQEGTRMSDLMALADKAGDQRATLRDLIKRAYRSPRFSTEEAKQNAIREFANQAELSCYDEFGD
jgi:hypothetical protein